MNPIGKHDKHGNAVIRLITHNNGKLVVGDIIREKNGDHVQIINEDAVDHIVYDNMIKKWDRVVPYICAMYGTSDDKVVHHKDIYSNMVLDGDTYLVNNDWCKVMGSASKSAKSLFMNGRISDCGILKVERHPLCEDYIPGHEEDVTGYWFKIKCPCCDEYV